MAEPLTTTDDSAERLRLGWITLLVGVLVFVAKLIAWRATGSTAVLSDALESIVNVVAGLFLLLSLKVAGQEADEDHPYGHGKVEFLSAGFEGALIAVAAVWIGIEAVLDLVHGAELQRIDTGLVLVTLATGLNAGFGSYLVRAGKRLHSPALEADGRHLLTDVITSAGTFVALLLVRLTGLAWLDPVIALLLGVHILGAGWKLIRGAIGGLMDEADPSLLARLVDALAEKREDSWIDAHGLRARSSGAVQHVDLHLVVPRFYDADQLHQIDHLIERALLRASGRKGESIVHFDPCRPRHCAECTLADCKIRDVDYAGRPAWTLEQLTRGDEVLETGRPLRER